MGKKVIFVVIDALASAVVDARMREGGLPVFRRIGECGGVCECTAVFPSITPAATASLATGHYPSGHGITGNFWYDREQSDVAYFGDDVWVIMERGFGVFFRDFLLRLNEERLATPTVFDWLGETGRGAACLNFMWYHGPFPHEVNAPLMVELLSAGQFPEQVNGPELLYLGDFVSFRSVGEASPAGGSPAGKSPAGEGRSEAGLDAISGAGGVAKRYGFQDETTAAVLLQLAERGELPGFTLAYFPDNDFRSHSEGPADAFSSVERVDEVLGEMIETLGGWDRFIEEYAIVVTGDHSQSDLLEDADERRIDLDGVLGGFQAATPGKGWQSGDRLMICPNLRAAQIYMRPGEKSAIGSVVDTLVGCPQIDQVIWREGQGDGIGRFHVATAGRGRLEFESATRGREAVADEWGNRWSWRGELAAVDGRLEEGRGEEGCVVFGDYPNAFERISQAFCDVSGDVWVTAKLGREFSVGSTKINPKGSHGSLHRLDSISPLLTAGLPDGVKLPGSARSVDLLGLCFAALGVEAPEAVQHFHGRATDLAVMSD